MRVKLLKTGLFSSRRPYILLTDVIYMLRNAQVDNETLAANLEKALANRNLL